MAIRDRFFIGPLESGLQKNVKPWLIPDDAFSLLNNAYVFRGRVKKRFGSYLMNQNVSATTDAPSLSSRLRINLGNTDGITGNISGTVPGIIRKVGQQFSINNEVFTVSVEGTPGVMLSTGAATVKTYNTTTGAFVINGAATARPLYFYPSEPVMGISHYETPTVNFEPTIAWDTQFAYQFITGFWVRIGAGATATWTGNNSNLFWWENYRGETADLTFLFTTNFTVADGIRFWNGTAWTKPVLTTNNAADVIKAARLVISFKGRLLLLNIVETVSAVDKAFGSRCRWSQVGDPLESDAWNDDIPGKGTFSDASTKEQIVSAQIIRDRLIVFFERSTWELVYTGNEVDPFKWQQINSELGVESPFSVVPFDKVAIGVGNVGIHACNGASVERIDQKIPDDVFVVRESENATDRVFGIRDYFTEMVYWTFPTEGTFSNKVLAFNYKTKSWSFFDDSFTAFGYFQSDTFIKTWQNSTEQWLESLDPWGDPQFKIRFRNVIAGNQNGLVVVLDPGLGRNAPSLLITNISSPAGQLTVVDHNLENGDYILIEDAQGITTLNNIVFTVRVVSSSLLDLFNPVTGEKITVTGAYTGAGRISRVSEIDIQTKQYNFYIDSGSIVNLSKVDFLVEKTEKGQITLDSFVSSTSLSLTQQGMVSGSLLGTNVLETSPFELVSFEAIQERLWHPVYFQAEGQTVQLRFYHTAAQLVNLDIVHSAFELHAMIFHTMAGPSRLE